MVCMMPLPYSPAYPVLQNQCGQSMPVAAVPLPLPAPPIPPSTMGVPSPPNYPPPQSLMLPGAALGSLAARFCWQGQRDSARARFGAPPLDAARRSTWEPRGSFLLAGAALQDGTRARFEPRGSFLLAGAALQALDGARARFGAPCLDAARRSTWEPCGSFLLAGAALQDGTRARFEPRGSFLLAGAALQALDGTRARFGARPSLDAARRSTWFGPPPP